MTKPERSFEPHLTVRRMGLVPGGEWTPRTPAWSFLRITAGAGYWLHPRVNYDVDTGSVLVISPRASGFLRASQLGPLVVHYFEVRPERLPGLVTISEQQFLQDLAAQDEFAVRRFAATTPISEKFRLLCEQVGAGGFSSRWQLLELFAQGVGEQLANHPGESDQSADARARLLKMLGELPASEFLDLEFTELVRQMGCTPRHLSRVFREIVGMSFREKQAQVRLLRAQELLATTRSKVVEVALESGYQSLSLFNLMFKRRFGISPAQWREQAQTPRAARTRSPSLRVLRA